MFCPPFLDEKLGTQSLVITEADNVALLILRVVHGHSEVAGAHGHLRTGPGHEVVDTLGSEVRAVRVVLVAKGGKPGVPRSVGILVDQRVGHD